jgi:serine/threonine protein phosphatase PrpC
LPYTWNGITYPTEGTHTTILSNIYGCDSAQINMTINLYPAILETVVDTTICNGGTLVWNGKTYQETKKDTVVLAGDNGCDSVVILNLTVLPKIVSYDTVTVCYGEKYYWVNCGDSRVYRLRDGELTQLSVDHSLINATGSKKHSNIITNCIGAGCKSSYIDMYDMTSDFLPGDTYMLCSDGLNDMLPDSEIEELMNGNATAIGLCEAAIQAGGFDNVSTCVFHVE